MRVHERHRYGLTKEQIAKAAVKNHKNGVLNPYAHIQNELTLRRSTEFSITKKFNRRWRMAQTDMDKRRAFSAN